MELDFQIAILADLQGPKFRIGYVKDKIILKKGINLFSIKKKILVMKIEFIYLIKRFIIVLKKIL